MLINPKIKIFSNNRHPSSKKPCHQSFFKVLPFGDASARTRSNDKLKPNRNIFEIWSHYLQDENVPGSCTIGEEQLH